MNRYLVKFSNGDQVEFDSFFDLSTKETFREAAKIAENRIDGKPVSAQRLIEVKKRDLSTRKMLKNVKLKVPTEAQNI